MMAQVLNKTVLITGANRGIGAELVAEFAAQGYCILACARKENADFEIRIRKLSEENGVHITPVYFDLADSEAVRKTVRAFTEKKICIDVLVNCAGVAHGGLFQMTPVSKIKEIFDINLFAQMELTQQILKLMVRRKSGCIVNFCSVFGADNYAGQCAYGASKAALSRWTQTLAAEVSSLGIRVNAVAPGLTQTDMAAQMDVKTREKMLGYSALKRAAYPQEVAKVVVWLASDEASMINGQIVRIDGGLCL